MRRSPGGGHGNPFQYSCLKNGVTELDTTEQLSTQKEKLHDEGPIAKKVVLPEKEEAEEIDPVVEKPLDEDFDVEPLTHKEDHNYDFPIIDDSEFGGEEDSKEETTDEPEIIRVVDPVEEEHDYERTNERHLYGIDESHQVNVMHYGSYETEKKMFRPSPIISPIYGVLDKNYKKEEIVNRTEVRLTSSYAKENLSVDDVRNKAYGASTEEEKPKHVSKEEKVEEVEETKDEGLVDLSSDEDKPEVKEVTVGDAEEYFNDLGLEYNNDYKDASKEKATGRRTTKKKEEVKEDSKEDIPTVEEDTDKESSDDNLFDLIDSMYEENNE